METLKYSQNKLVVRMAAAGVVGVGAIYLFANPDLVDDGVGQVTMFSGDLGHYAAIPATIIVCAIFVWLAASRLMNGRNAVECLPDEIRVTTYWGRTRIRWENLGHVYIQKKRTRYYMRQSFLVFHYIGAGLFGSKRIRVPLDVTELPSHRFEAFRESILAQKRIAENRPAGSQSGGAPAASFADGDGSGFDPDAALARYLARKSEQTQSPPPAPTAPVSIAPARAQFGRKGL